MLDWQDTYKLSRFAILRADQDGFLLESPLASREFRFCGASVIRVLAALTRPVQLESLLSAVEEPDRTVLRSFLITCNDQRLLTRVREDGIAEEDVGPLGYWEFHDLLFHTSTRLGRNRHPVGGTYRLRNRLPPEPALRQDDDNPELLILPKPDPKGMEMPFTQVLERRRSRYGQERLTLEALGAFLYWTCRATKLTGHGDEVLVQKLYPSGGSLHPLQVCVAINACDDCAPGLYRYLDHKHALSLVATSDSTVQKFFADAFYSTGGLSQNTPALFIISARFHRTAWKYESIAYRLILMEVGVLLQTMYLAATALDLKGCALGCGDSDHFARAVGTDYYVETSVGEFLLGR